MAKLPRRYLSPVTLGASLRPSNPLKATSPTTRLPHPCLAPYERGDVAFEVPLDKCVSLQHFGYGPGGWHPFVAALRQYAENPRTTYASSSLRTFYEACRPENVLAAYLGHLPLYERHRDAPSPGCPSGRTTPSSPGTRSRGPPRARGPSTRRTGTSASDR